MSPLLDSFGSSKGFGWSSISEIPTYIAAYSQVTTTGSTAYSTLSTDYPKNSKLALGGEGIRFVDIPNNEWYPIVKAYKFNNDGSIAWEDDRTMNLLQNSNFTYVASVTDSSDNIYYAFKYYSGAWIAALVKYSSSGVLQWAKGFTGGGQTILDLAIDAGGNICATVDLSPYTYLYRIDPSGTIVSRQYTDLRFAYVDTDSSGGIYLSGYYSSGANFAAGLIKTTNTNIGNIALQRSITFTSVNALPSGVKVDSTGNIYIGLRQNNVATLVKLNSSGTFQWARQTNNNNNSSSTIFVDELDNPYICVMGTDPSGQSSQNILKYDSSGTLQYQRHFKISPPGGQTWNVAKASAWFVAKNRMFINHRASANVSGTSTIVALGAMVPTDGSKTGSYTISSRTWLYGASSLVTSNVTPTVATPSLNYGTSAGTLFDVSWSSASVPFSGYSKVSI